MKTRFKNILLLAGVTLAGMAFAKENIGTAPANGNLGGAGIANKLQNPNLNVQAADCEPASAEVDLDINNIRARIFNAGDMWWDRGLGKPRYEIPKGGGKHSMFASCIWIGGLDQGGQLKVAAMTYRQFGNDFWPGPLDNNASIDKATCKKYDKQFKITRSEVETFVSSGFKNPTPAIINWPGNGNVAAGQDPFLAPFVDANNDGIYDPNDKDYPGYDINNLSTPATCNDYIFGDQTLFWVFNDKGNIHTETGGESIGLEIRAQAFAFQTNDEINNMTFYKYQVINRSSLTLGNTYFGWWSDVDLGKYDDDYVGCDVKRGLGFAYNGDQDDEGPTGYGKNPPASGVDFFQGPIADIGDGVDNDRDGVIDEAGEQIIMSKFVYFNNDFTVIGNPSTATHYYNYLKGVWKDNNPMTYGGDGHQQGNPLCNFMFPDDTDPAFANNPWAEDLIPNAPADRRFIQSAGTFTLKPGAVNYVTVGAVWARATQGGPRASVKLLKDADDKAQSLFDNCFKILNGPDAPDMTHQELNKELLFYLTNKKVSTNNNINESYAELDPTIPSSVVSSVKIDSFVTVADADKYYRFQGYQVYQLKNVAVSTTDLDNPDLARLVFQCDVQDGVAQLVNFTFNPALNASIPVEKVNGEDKGITHSFRVTEDLFASGNTRLINHKEYYYMAISYAYNNYKSYDQNSPLFLDGQKIPYKPGRRNIKVITAIPHIPASELGGTAAQSVYGMGPNITRIEGQGNGGQILELTSESIDKILADGRMDNPVYKKTSGPLNVKVIDPLNVPDGEFEFKLIADPNASPLKDELNTATWTLTNKTSGVTVTSDRAIDVANEQILADWGLSITVKQVKDPGVDRTQCSNHRPLEVHNGFIEATMEFADDTKAWLSGIPDIDGESSFNWIRSGNVLDGTATVTALDEYLIDPCLGASPKDRYSMDPDQDYEQVLGGTWAPYRLCAYQPATTNPFAQFNPPAWNDQTTKGLNTLEKLQSVDIVITSDKSKWTRCPVLETCEFPQQAEGGAKHMDLRKGTSVDKDGNPETGSTGMGWFPGYAICVETGERLNMAFGEDSWLIGENGRDMKWNPTDRVTTNLGGVLFGGKHYLYVFGHFSNVAGSDMPAYDEGAFMYSKLSTGLAADKRAVFKDAMWVNIPLADSRLPFLASDVKIRIRVTKPYEADYATNAYLVAGVGNTRDVNAPKAASTTNNDNPVYTFNTHDLMTLKSDMNTAKNALELINIVPNPYYAYSNYETGQLDNRVKITNLPDQCTVDIYSVNGKLIRSFTKDDPKTSLDWDLKNQAGIIIGSGLYIIHVNVEGVGEKTIKWFGAVRPVDLQDY